jgi:hypothetical protein
MFLSILISLSTIITKNIVFHPFKMCLVALQYKIPIFYLLIVGYIIPLLTIIIIYAIIYRRIIRSTLNFQRSSNRTKCDGELARNILILLSIFSFGGIPTLIYIIVSNKMGTAPSISVAVETMMNVVLNKDYSQWNAA